MQVPTRCNTGQSIAVRMLCRLEPGELVDFRGPDYDKAGRHNPNSFGRSSMFRLRAGDRRLCDGLHRRDVLRIGSASLVGLALPDMLRAAGSKPAKVKSV